MIFSSLVLLLAALAPAIQPAAAQYQMTYGPDGNKSTLVGYWSSGAGHVSTGDGFANPTNRSFTYPKTAGIAYSFTGDGFFELSRYRFTSNGSEPTCITGVIGWAHGTYELADNGTMTLHPWEDSFQQIQDPCAAVSNFIENYNGTETYMAWQVYEDTAKGVTARLYQFDGTPLPPMQRRSTTPNMLPTQKLANATGMASDESTTGNGVIRKRNSAPSPSSTSLRSAGAVALGLAGVATFFL